MSRYTKNEFASSPLSDGWLPEQISKRNGKIKRARRAANKVARASRKANR